MTLFFPINRRLSHFRITFSHCHITAPFAKMATFEKFLLESGPLQTVYETISIITKAKNKTVFSENQVVFEEDDYIRTIIYDESTRIQEFNHTSMIATTEARSVFYEHELYERR